MPLYKYRYRTRRNCLFECIGRMKAFTLPEVIISVSVLVLVVASAVGLLTSVIRTNSINVNSLVANGLAQEGLEAMRFMRDSNALLGLDFNDVKNSDIWGIDLSENANANAKYFVLVENFSNKLSFNNNAIVPLQYSLRNISLNEAAKSVPTPIKFAKLEKINDDFFRNFTSDNLSQLLALAPVCLDEKENFNYFQSSSSNCEKKTQFSRVIRVEPLFKGSSSTVYAFRVSSIVAWADAHNNPSKIVLTTDLTDWK